MKSNGIVQLWKIRFYYEIKKITFQMIFLEEESN